MNIETDDDVSFLDSKLEYIWTSCLFRDSANFPGWKQIVGLKILRSIYDKLKLLFLVKKL